MSFLQFLTVNIEQEQGQGLFPSLRREAYQILIGVNSYCFDSGFPWTNKTWPKSNIRIQHFFYLDSDLDTFKVNNTRIFTTNSGFVFWTNQINVLITYFWDELVKQNKIMSRCLVSIVVNKRRVLTEPLLYTSMSLHQQGSFNNNKTSTTFLLYTNMSFHQQGSFNNNKTSTAFLLYTSISFHQQGSFNNTKTLTTFLTNTKWNSTNRAPLIIIKNHRYSFSIPTWRSTSRAPLIIIKHQQHS